MNFSWSDICSVIDPEFAAFQKHGIKVLGGYSSPTPEQFDAMILRLEKSSNEALDEACRHFSATRRWPHLDKDALFFLFHRVGEAHWLAHLFRQSPHIFSAPSSFATEAQILSWLLVDYWKRIGRTRALGMLLSESL